MIYLPCPISKQLLLPRSTTAGSTSLAAFRSDPLIYIHLKGISDFPHQDNHGSKHVLPTYEGSFRSLPWPTTHKLSQLESLPFDIEPEIMQYSMVFFAEHVFTTKVGGSGPLRYPTLPSHGMPPI